MSINVTLKDDSIIINGQCINTDIEFGIAATDFFDIHKWLGKKGIKIKRIRFNRKEVGLNRDDIRTMKDNLTKDIVSFEILCYEINKFNIPIDPLISQFNAAQRNLEIYDMRHTMSLARLGYEYLLTNHSVEYLSEPGPDLKIDGFSADLKVRKEVDFNLRFLDFNKLYNFESGVFYTLRIDPTKEFIIEVEKAERSRSQKALEQASVIFVDLSYVIRNIPKDQGFFYPPYMDENKWIFYTSELSHFKPRWRHVWISTYYIPETYDFVRSDDGSVKWK